MTHIEAIVKFNCSVWWYLFKICPSMTTFLFTTFESDLNHLCQGLHIQWITFQSDLFSSSFGFQPTSGCFCYIALLPLALNSTSWDTNPSIQDSLLRTKNYWYTKQLGWISMELPWMKKKKKLISKGKILYDLIYITFLKWRTN